MVLVARTVIAVLVIAIVAWAGSAVAQPVEITAPTPSVRPPEPIVIPPGDYGQVTRPSDADYYAHPPMVRYDPAFIGPMSNKTENPRSTGRVGIAGWTSPTTPVGSAQNWREITGYFALGFAVEWGGPLPPVKKSPPAP
jgi:hypothetical protein